MSKIIVMVFILAFWIFLPLPFMIMGVGGFENLDLTDLETQENPTFLNYLTLIWSFVSIYFRILVIGFYGVPIYINLFIWLLKAITGFVLVLVLRGN